ncbi:hypothetical protein [Cupriavidus pauculus]|uniref:hypothetical protein n=1 Tax=Cupriavidus pauculus TaxID=82633 RepID=UPI001EE2944B|nr:hypothetical protein [Cupriavidus pauculus]GJG94382.1 hypothetical protein CBA19C6_07855 [Cupriavidus pauculus]
MSAKGVQGALFAFCSIVVATTAALGAERAEDRPPRGAYMASQCKDARACPLFDDVYATTPPFRHALSLSLRHGRLQVPDWVKAKLEHNRNGPADDVAGSLMDTASPMLPLRIDGRSYLLGRMMDPANAQHRIVALYDTTRGSITVRYFDEKGKTALFGDTTEILVKVITDYVNPDSPFSRSANRTDVSLPIPVSSKQ